MNTRLHAYRQRREELLERIAAELSADERFVAAWLTGSYSRNEADFLSDIDLTLVVSDPHSAQLCTRHEQVSPRTSPERYALFSQFGIPALIHENNNNAPAGGTFTFVLYAGSAVMIDWVLIPQSIATRPARSRLLFQKTEIPVEPAPTPDDREQSRKYVAEQWAFFWMMTAVTIKYIQRGDGVFAAQWIEHLHALLEEIDRRLKGQPWSYRRGSLSKLQPTPEKQLESIRDLCNRMLEHRARVAEFIGAEPATPTAEIDRLASLVESAAHES